MSALDWIKRRRSMLATAVASTAVLAVVAGVAISSTGYTAQALNLGDGTVWVANGSEQVIGRANPAVLELNAVVAAGASDLQLVQEGSDVLLVDTANAALDVVDPVTTTLGSKIPLPPDQPAVFLAHGMVVIESQGTGDLWIVPLDQLGTFDSASTPTLSLGAGAVVSLAPSGILVAGSPTLGEVDKLDITAGDTVQQRWAITADPNAGTPSGDTYQITSVGGHWAVLDAVSRQLTTESGQFGLQTVIPAGSAPRLQQPSDDGDGVLVASSAGLVRAPLGGGAPQQLVSDQSGEAAAPAVLGGCAYAAWTSGTAWRDCGTATTMALQEMPGSARLAFARNGTQLVLNDSTGGGTWAVQQDGALIDNWQALIVPDQQQQQVIDDQNDIKVDPDQKPPVAVDDQFGARPGRTTVLPVLLNDYDPNGDVLVITGLPELDPKLGTLNLVTRNQQLEVTLPATASGRFTFQYTIADGRGGTDSASCTVTVHPFSQNAPPVQVRQTHTAVRQGGRVETDVSGDWVDPDGDPVFLSRASVPSPDKLGYKPDGVVSFQDASGSTASVSLVMSDGRSEGNGSLRVDVEPSGQVPITVEPWVVLATVGETLTLRPLNHVRGGSGTVRLNAVPAKAGVTLVPSFEAGTFTFETDRVGTQYVQFTVTDGSLVQTGFVRIDVSPPADAGTRPITVPHSVYVSTLSSQDVDPTTTDIDPAGGVLVVTGITAPATGSGVKAEVLDQHTVRVTLTGPLDTGPVQLKYTISNGLADAIGTITVIEIPRPARLQPPIADDDSVTVRVGAVVDIPVLDNDEQPDGAPITLDHELTTPLPDGGGLLFASGDHLRYLAPQTAGNYTAVYSITSSDGQQAQARVRISVREVDAATNSAPNPERVTARALAGETITIAIPLTGIDPDGDSVQLIGVASSPDKGNVLSVGSDSIEYQAGEYSSGTDVFHYTVVDQLGARADGIVRVGISPRLPGARNPVANADEVSVRPGRSVSVQVLANDSDPDGGALTVTSAKPTLSSVTAKVVQDSIVTVTPPSTPGSYSVVYSIENQYGGTSSAFITVTVDPNAPLAYPVANDTVLTVSDVLGRDSLDVDVLANVFWADGDVSDLGLDLVPGYSDTAQVLPSKQVHVQIGNKSQIIPFAVSRPDDPSVRAFAFLFVPGYDDALPQLNRAAPLLEVRSEQTLRIDLAQYVVALGGRTVHLVDTASVEATHANGDPLVVDDHTLAYTSAQRYFGPASITFEVTDGTSASDPNGRRAILTLPIQVDPRDNQPPVFIGGVVDFEPGQSKELDLVRLTNYPYPDVNELAYTVLDPKPQGFDVQLNGQRLVLTAGLATPKGTQTSIQLGVRDAVNDGEAGRIELDVVPSTQPLVQPINDSAVTKRGQTTTIDVLANDEVNNPFPGTPLTVVGIRGLDGANLPDGVSITPNATKSQLTVTVSSAAQPIDTNLQYEVADATQDPDRYVWGNVTISVQDVPDPVTDFHVAEFGDKVLRLSWTPGNANNSPIDHYDVTMTDASSGDVLSVTSCTATVNCAIATPGNGPSHAVKFTVVAINAIGKSTPVGNAAGAIWSDVIPDEPSNVNWAPLDHGLEITWQKPQDPANGSPIDRYVITVGSETRTMTVDPGDATGTSYTEDISGIGSLRNGSSVSYSVSARNAAPSSLANWNSSGGTGVPAWTPLVIASPTASGFAAQDGSQASASWDGSFDSNGKAITEYDAAIVAGTYDAGDPALPDCAAAANEGTSTGDTFSGLTPNTAYTVVVYAQNGLGGCSDQAVAHVIPRSTPTDVTAASFSGPTQPSDDGSIWDFKIDSVSTAAGAADAFRYRLTGDGVDGSTSGIVEAGAYARVSGGSQYGVHIGIQVQACAVYPERTVCSPDWSDTYDLGVPVQSKTPGGLAASVDPDTSVATWTWGSSPNGAYDSVQYTCDGGATWTAIDPMGSGGSCTVPGDPTGTQLTVRITANGGQHYDRSYDWADYD